MSKLAQDQGPARAEVETVQTDNDLNVDLGSNEHRNGFCAEPDRNSRDLFTNDSVDLQTDVQNLDPSLRSKLNSIQPYLTAAGQSRLGDFINRLTRLELEQCQAIVQDIYDISQAAELCEEIGNNRKQELISSLVLKIGRPIASNGNELVDSRQNIGYTCASAAPEEILVSRYPEQYSKQIKAFAIDGYFLDAKGNRIDSYDLRSYQEPESKRIPPKLLSSQIFQLSYAEYINGSEYIFDANQSISIDPDNPRDAFTGSFAEQWIQGFRSAIPDGDKYGTACTTNLKQDVKDSSEWDELQTPEQVTQKIKTDLDQGREVMVELYFGKEGHSLHMLVVKDIFTADDGKTYVSFSNSWGKFLPEHGPPRTLLEDGTEAMELEAFNSRLASAVLYEEEHTVLESRSYGEEATTVEYEGVAYETVITTCFMGIDELLPNPKNQEPERAPSQEAAGSAEKLASAIEEALKQEPALNSAIRTSPRVPGVNRVIPGLTKIEDDKLFS